METKAVVRYARMSPQKARLVADLVRGKKVNDALNILRFTNKATARILYKVVASAKANAENNNAANGDNLKIEKIFVDMGPVMKRQLPRSRGRVDMVRKPFSHVTVVLTELEEGKKRKAAKKAEPKKEGETAAPKKAAAKKETVAGETKAEAKKPAAKKANKKKES